MKKIIWINLSKKLRKSGVQIYNDNLKNIIGSKFKILNLYPLYKANFFPKFFEKYITKYFKINDLCKKYNTSYVVLPDESFLIVGILLALQKKKPIIIIHDYKNMEIIKKISFVEKIKYFLLLPFFFFLNNFHYVITVSKTSESILKKRYKINRILTIYNLFKNKKKKKNYKYSKINKQKIILNISNDLSHKNFFVILKSLKKISNVLLIKIGKPMIKSLRNKYKKYINMNQLNVKLVNEVSHNSLNNYYKKCDLYVNPSYHEGFGRTNIEALMHKKNVICSDIKINREILKNNVSYVKNFMSEDAWAKKINNFFLKRKVYSKFKNNYLISKNKNKYRYKLYNVFNS